MPSFSISPKHGGPTAVFNKIRWYFSKASRFTHAKRLLLRETSNIYVQLGLRAALHSRVPRLVAAAAREAKPLSHAPYVADDVSVGARARTTPKPFSEAS